MAGWQQIGLYSFLACCNLNSIQGKTCSRALEFHSVYLPLTLIDMWICLQHLEHLALPFATSWALRIIICFYNVKTHAGHSVHAWTFGSFAPKHAHTELWGLLRLFFLLLFCSCMCEPVKQIVTTLLATNEVFRHNNKLAQVMELNRFWLSFCVFGNSTYLTEQIRIWRARRDTQVSTHIVSIYAMNEITRLLFFIPNMIWSWNFLYVLWYPTLCCVPFILAHAFCAFATMHANGREISSRNC